MQSGFSKKSYETKMDISLKEFVVKDPNKTKKGVKTLSPAFEKIASDLYELCGVEVPKTYLIRKKEDDSTRYLLASRKLPDYKDLHDYFDEQNNKQEKAQSKIEELDRLERTDRETHLSQYKDFLTRLNIKELEKLFIAYIFLQDLDVIGRYFNNIGLIPDQKTHKIIKIDPGNANFKPEKFEGEFKKELEVDNPLILNANRPENDLIGIFNTRIREVFQLVTQDEDKVLEAIAHLIRIPNDFFHQIIFNEEILKEGVISKNECEEVFNVLQKRRKAFAEVYKSKLIDKKILSEEDYSEIEENLNSTCEYFSESADLGNHKIDPSIYNRKKFNFNQRRVILDSEEFIDKKEKIHLGNSRPRLFYKKIFEEKHHAINHNIDEAQSSISIKN